MDWSRSLLSVTNNVSDIMSRTSSNNIFPTSKSTQESRTSRSSKRNMSDLIPSTMAGSRDPSPSNSAQIPALTREQEAHRRRIERAHIRQISKHEDDLKNTITSLEAQLEEAEKEIDERKANEERLKNQIEAQKKDFDELEDKMNVQIKQLQQEQIKMGDSIGSFGKSQNDLTSVEREMAAQIKDLKEKVAALEVENMQLRKTPLTAMIRTVENKLDSVVLDATTKIR